MTDVRRIAVVTSSRADYGLLRCPMLALRDCADLDLRLIVTGTHLAPGFGTTVTEIERDNFVIAERVEMLLDSDSAVGTSHSMGLALMGMARAYAALRPDLVLLLGDRYEIFAAAAAALIARIPLAHIAGGDITTGAYDDAMRHAITKMAHVHFPSTEQAAKVIRQLGEDPEQIHCVGNPALDAIGRVDELPRAEVFARLGLAPRARNVIVTYHPVTLGGGDAAAEIDALLTALTAAGPDLGIIITGANADTGHAMLRRALAAFADSHPNAVLHESLGQALYFNTLRQVDAVIGNSSSGLLEAPSFGIPTVNIGPRQDGRVRAGSIIDCAPQRDAIVSAMQQAAALDCSNITNPYGDGRASERIVAVLRALEAPRDLLRKTFRLQSV